MSAHARKAPEPEFSLRGHTASIGCVRFVEHGGKTLLASGDVDGECKLWDLSSRRAARAWRAGADKLGVLEMHQHAGGGSLLAQSRDGRIRLWDLERLGAGGAAEDALTTTLATNSFFFAKCSVASNKTCDYEYEPEAEAKPPKRKEARAKAATGIGACVDPREDDPGPGEKPQKPTVHWSQRAAAADHLVLAATEPPEACLLWDTRCASPAARLQPKDGERADATAANPILGNVMVTKLWLPAAGAAAPPLALVGHEGGAVLAWDLRLLRPRLYARTPPGAFSSPCVGLDIDREGKVMFVAGVEATARAVSVGEHVLRPHSNFALPVACEAAHEMDQKHGVGTLALRPDGRVLGTAGWDRRARLFSARAPYRPLAVLRYHDAAVNALDWSADSALLAT
eukprot:CAMPEP_0119270196 /NCGR_PEP_ID=MMETSP1329-20130426/7300_1 /TAXON_ID=114041 /ORGANISM="Genus nov. species nov., Strain RCC1024" /LENGTH=398 /DNA_ID=CAMNT_0007270207 /DNA_START=112 /DNA_END=1304 /DNA_ORIENTATION=-